jgi:hypothetical protein
MNKLKKNIIGTGGPKQTVIGTGPLNGSPRIYPSPTKTPGVAQQTVYTPRGGLTVLVGTGGPTQTVHNIRGQHHSSSSSTDYYDEHIDSLSPSDRKKYDDRGDIPGYMIPGYNHGK